MSVVAELERDPDLDELLERMRKRSEAERAAMRERARRRELAAALEDFDPDWADPVKVKARVRELGLTATALLDAFAVVYAEMRWVELRGLWAATVDAQGDTELAGRIWGERYGADIVTAIHHRVEVLFEHPDRDPAVAR